MEIKTIDSFEDFIMRFTRLAFQLVEKTVKASSPLQIIILIEWSVIQVTQRLIHGSGVSEV